MNGQTRPMINPNAAGHAARAASICCLSMLLFASACNRSNGDTPNNDQPEEEASKRQVKELIENYFHAWSRQDMEGYAGCFASSAVVQYMDDAGQISNLSLKSFLASQREAHARAQFRLTEVPESIDIRLESKLARAVVYWKLTAGPRTEYGYDHFTLAKQQGQWRVVHLIFYATKRSG